MNSSLFKKINQTGLLRRIPNPVAINNLTTHLVIVSRGLKKLAYGKFLSVSRFRMRKGLPPAPSASGPLTDDPDWSYIDGRPGLMNKGQSLRYLRDQEFGRTMVDFNKQFETIKEFRKKASGVDMRSKKEEVAQSSSSSSSSSSEGKAR